MKYLNKFLAVAVFVACLMPLTAGAFVTYPVNANLQPGDVTGSTILDGTILNIDIGAAAAIAFSKLAALTSGDLLIGSAGNVPTDTAVTGDVTISNTGVTAIGSGKVTNSMLSAAITVPNGGTGLGTLTANNVILGNGTSSPTFVAPGTSGNVLTSNGSTWASTIPAGQPAWTDEGSISWSAATGDQTLTFAHAGKDKYECFVNLLATANTNWNLLLNNISAANYAYTLNNGTTLTRSTAQSAFAMAGSSAKDWQSTFFIQGVHNAGLKEIYQEAGEDAANSTLVRGFLTGDSANLSSIVTSFGGSTITGKIHCYGLSL